MFSTSPWKFVPKDFRLNEKLAAKIFFFNSHGFIPFSNPSANTEVSPDNVRFVFVGSFITHLSSQPCYIDRIYIK